MSINDKDALTGPKGSDVVDGMRNFTDTSNPVTEEQQQNANRYDAWAAAGDRGMGSGQPGVIEAEPGLVESTKIDPLKPAGSEASADDTTSTNPGSTAYDSVVGAAKQAYGSLTGDAATEREGKQQYDNA